MAVGRPAVVVDPAAARRLEALVRAGKSSREIHATMTREGLDPPSRATIGRMAKGRTGRPASIAARAPKGAASPKPAAAATPPSDAVARWETLAEQLQKQASKALEDDDVATFNAISRTLNQALAQLARITPPPAASAEDAPDMIEAAASGRAKLLDYLERARLGKS